MKKLLTFSLFFASLLSISQAHAWSTNHSKWGDSESGTSGGVVTWSLMETGTSCLTECDGGSFTSLTDFMPAGFETQIVNAFAAWSAVANITFLQVSDSGDYFNKLGATGDIRIGGETIDGANGVLAHGYAPPPNGLSAAGDIHFDIAEDWDIAFEDPGFSIFQVLAHEIGHAIGLGHSDVPSSLMNSLYSETFIGLQADDIAGAQAIYGAATHTVSAVPLPPALWMLFSGLGILLARPRVNA